MKSRPQGRREVGEAVVQAALVTLATELVTWAFGRVKEWWEREPPAQTVE